MNILEEAIKITTEDRAEAYGPSNDVFIKTANICKELGLDASKPEAIPVIFIVNKLVRESHRHKRDNLVDIAGYCRLLNKLYTDEDIVATVQTTGDINANSSNIPN